MIIEIDTQNKIIKLKDKCNLNEFLEYVDKYFGLTKGREEYSIDTNIVENFNQPWQNPNPLILPTIPYVPQPIQPYYTMPYCGDTSDSGEKQL